jgi:predicted oxidoreductase
MPNLPYHAFFPEASRLIFGTMNLGGGWNSNPLSKDDIKQAHELLETSLEHGINVIDLADIYTYGKAEQVVGKVFAQNKALREQFIVQSKIGIRLTPDTSVNHYDLSGRWVTEALHASLKRLGIDCLDVLFLHRPDPLMQVENMAGALNNLHKQDMFDFLSVSNMHAGQMAYIQSYVDMPMICNQLEMSLAHSSFIEDGMTNNMAINAQMGFPRGTLEYCMQHKIQLQAWGALAQGQFSDENAQDPNIANAAKLIKRLAEEYDCSNSAIVLAWLMTHPAQIQPVIGSTKPSRIAEAAQANKVSLSREHWYQILEARRGQSVP